VTDESKLPALPEAAAAVTYGDGRHGFAARHAPWPNGSHNLYTAAQMLAYASQAVAAVAEDAARLDAIASEYWTLAPFDMPTGQGDADVGWRVTQYVGMARKPEVIAEHFFDNPRAAIDAAMKEDDHA
jgi:hypothetical protein